MTDEEFAELFSDKKSPRTFEGTDKTYIERTDFSNLPRGFFDIPISKNPTPPFSVGSISNYVPTPREKLAYFLNRTIFSDDRAGQDRAEFLLRPIDVSPAAIPFAAYDTTRAIGEGRYKDAILPSITVAAPFIGRFAKVLPGVKHIGPGDSVIENFPSSAKASAKVRKPVCPR